MLYVTCLCPLLDLRFTEQLPAGCATLDRSCGIVPQATRLVKNSLIAIDQTDVDVDDPEAAAEEDALAAAAEARQPDGDAAHAGVLRPHSRASAPCRHV